jgi:hypothetical protein
MNERIKELMEQAEDPEHGFIIPEKFAELIVHDMHKKVITSILITDVVMEEKGQVPTPEDYIQAINKDFGVVKEIQNEMPTLFFSQ